MLPEKLQKLHDFAKTRSDGRDPYHYIALLIDDPKWDSSSKHSEAERGNLLNKFEDAVERNPYLKELWDEYQNINEPVAEEYYEDDPYSTINNKMQELDINDSYASLDESEESEEEAQEELEEAPEESEEEEALEESENDENQDDDEDESEENEGIEGEEDSEEEEDDENREIEEDEEDDNEEDDEEEDSEEEQIEGETEQETEEEEDDEEEDSEIEENENEPTILTELDAVLRQLQYQFNKIQMSNKRNITKNSKRRYVLKLIEQFQKS